MLALLLAALLGCSGGPSAVRPPSIDAGDAAEAALSAYDRNDDGAIAGEELDQAPALMAALENLDADGDQRITADEIEARIDAWQETGLGLRSTLCNVLLDGKPLPGATVTLEPEAFLGEEVKPASGQTDDAGVAYLTIAEEHRPAPEVTGVQCGLYRVRISKQQAGQDLLPARYNSETTLGCEVAPDATQLRELRMLRFELQSGA